MRAAAILLFVAVVAGAGLSAATETQPTPGESYPGVFGPDAKLGYVLRQEGWNGSLPVGDNTPIRQQLFKNNDYRFYVWSDGEGREGVRPRLRPGWQPRRRPNLGKSRTAETHFAEVDVRPESTGSYYLIVKVEQSSSKSTAWQMAYAYK